MSFWRFLTAAVALSSALAACGGGDETSGTQGFGGSSGGSGPSSTSTGMNDIPGLTSMDILPMDAVVEATPAMAGVQVYKVMGHFQGQPDQDITDKVGLSLTDGSVGSISATQFTSTTTHGGSTKVVATANGGTVAAQTGLTVHFSAVVKGPDNGTPLPMDPTVGFKGMPDPSRAPQLVYPNDGVMVPPNLKRLEVHFRPGSNQNTLFQIEFSSKTAVVDTYLRCVNPMNGGCVFELDQATYGYVALSNAGLDPATLTVRGSDDGATGFGESAKFSVGFAETEVKGGLYYWTTTNGTAIMRFDFGGDALMPDVFLSPSLSGFDTCVGCHALSRDGAKMVASLGGQNDGRIVYLDDVSMPNNFALKGDSNNRIQFASFNPDGSRFVAIYGDTNVPDRNKLWLHDGTTGQELPAESMDLAFEPDHPDWSPDGSMIAIDHVGGHNTSQRPQNCGIELLTKMGNGFGLPVPIVPTAPGLNRYNPNFAPDSKLFVYSESTCPGGNTGSGDCDGDADDSAKTWAQMPMPGAAPVLLAKAGGPGVEDQGKTDLADTFPRFAPFEAKQGSGRLFWITISSRRRLGLRDPGGHQLLWMFAVDPDKVLAGKDGTYPAFFLPFQDLGTSNHIAQWTQAIVTMPPQ